MPGTTQPQAKKKISRSTQKGGAQQDLVVHPRAPAHHQAHAVVLAPSATLGSMPELIDAEASKAASSAVGWKGALIPGKWPPGHPNAAPAAEKIRSILPRSDVRSSRAMDADAAIPTALLALSASATSSFFLNTLPRM